MSIILNLITSFFYFLIGFLVVQFFRIIILAFAYPGRGIPPEQVKELKVWIIIGGVTLLVLAWRLSTYEHIITPPMSLPVDTPLLSMGRERMLSDVGLSVFLAICAMRAILRILGPSRRLQGGDGCLAIGWFWASVSDGKRNQRYKSWWLERIAGDVCWGSSSCKSTVSKG